MVQPVPLLARSRTIKHTTAPAAPIPCSCKSTILTLPLRVPLGDLIRKLRDARSTGAIAILTAAAVIRSAPRSLVIKILNLLRIHPDVCRRPSSHLVQEVWVLPQLFVEVESRARPIARRKVGDVLGSVIPRSRVEGAGRLGLSPNFLHGLVLLSVVVQNLAQVRAPRRILAWYSIE